MWIQVKILLILVILRKIEHQSGVLRFIDTKKKETDIVYKKVVQICPRCNVDMILLLKNRIKTTHQWESRTCDFHQDYYQAQEKMNEAQQCVSFRAFKYDEKYRNYIHRKAFYYTCPSCNNWDICAGCTLIKTELRFKNNIMNTEDNHNHNIQPPPSKKQKISSEAVLTSSVGAAIQSQSDCTNNIYSARDIVIIPKQHQKGKQFRVSSLDSLPLLKPLTHHINNECTSSSSRKCCNK